MTATLLLALAAGPDVSDLAQFRGLLAEAESAYSVTESVVRETHFKDDGTENLRYELAETTHGRSHHVRHTSDRWPTTLHGSNPAYTFRLERYAAAWRLTWLCRSSDEPADGPAPPGHRRTYTRLQLPFGNSTINYREELARPRANPRFLPAVEFEGPTHPAWRFDGRTLGDTPFTTTLVLDLDRPGLVRAVLGIDPDAPDRPPGGFRIEYQPTTDRWPPPARIEYWSWIANRRVPGQLLLLNLSEVVSYRRLATPPSAGVFTLTAFGLPEPATIPDVEVRYPQPPDPNQPQFPTPELPGPPDESWQWWAIGGILAVGLVAFVLAGRRGSGT